MESFSTESRMMEPGINNEYGASQGIGDLGRRIVAAAQLAVALHRSAEAESGRRGPAAFDRLTLVTDDPLSPSEDNAPATAVGRAGKFA